MIKISERFKQFRSVSSEIMENVYNELKTPIKHGPVLKLNEYFTDSPSVFRLKNDWFMLYITIDPENPDCGYDTWLAVSSDLFNWNTLGRVMSRNIDCAWDCRQKAGYLALMDIDWEGSNSPGLFDGKYFISYLGGNKSGYEPDPLSMGLAFTSDLTYAHEYERHPEPILSASDLDSRWFEKITLYKSFIFEDKARQTGYRYVNFYNCKQDGERIGMAVSDNMTSWERFGEEPVIDDRTQNSDVIISGDPQIIKWNNLYIMFYFIYKRNSCAYNTFACSYDLVNWTKWEGEPLIKSEYTWENVHAHKSWVIKHEGTVYHYYCAVNKNNERFIALATSR